MDNTEGQLKILLNGGGLNDDSLFCDFSLTAQNEALASKGITPTGPTEFIPVTKKTLTYIVAAVIVNENKEVLMMQEANRRCPGQWYLPAGRMEAGETITEAVKREVLEETGLDIEPTTLLMVESATGVWYRFVLTGIVTGGRLKTEADADEESLQAKWVRDVRELNLRANDVLPLIEKGLEYHNRQTSDPWHVQVLPAVIGHTKLYMRLAIVIRKKVNNRVHVLVSEKDHVHLPLCEIHPLKSLHSTLKKYMNEVFGSDLPQHRPHGILSVEYNGIPAAAHDGMCLNILVSIRQPLEEVMLIDKYSWKETSPSIGDDLITRLAKNLTVPLHVIR